MNEISHDAWVKFKFKKIILVLKIALYHWVTYHSFLCDLSKFAKFNFYLIGKCKLINVTVQRQNMWCHLKKMHQQIQTHIPHREILTGHFTAKNISLVWPGLESRAQQTVIKLGWPGLVCLSCLRSWDMK